MENKSLKSQVVHGVFWSSMERFLVQGVQFVLSIILARLLNPSDYGVIGMTAIFIAVGQTFIDSGFSTALIRKTDVTETDYSTVFYFSIVVGVLAYFVIFFISPIAANFYNTPILNPVLKVICLNLVISSFATIQRAILTIKIDFKTQSIASLSAVLISGIVGIVCAYKGIGVWALVIQQILNNLLNTLLLWVFTKWKPSLIFSWKSFKELFGFGSKILCSALLETIYKNLYSIVIGKKFSSTDLGYYTRADNFAQYPSSNMVGILGRVLYPIFCKIQNDDNKLAKVYEKYLRLSAYIIFPLMTGLAAVAVPFVQMILTQMWIQTAYYLQIICFAMMWYPIHAINLNVLQVKGRSDLYLRLEIIKKFVGVSVLCITLPHGIKFMCYGMIFNSLIGLIINTYYTGKLINVGYFRQMKILFPSLFYSVSMFCVVYFSINLFNTPFTKLLFGIIIGVVYYFLISVVTRSKDFKSLISVLKRETE